MDASSTRTQFKKNLKYWANFYKNNPNYKANCSKLAKKSDSGINTKTLEEFLSNLQFLAACSKSILRDFALLKFDNETAIELIDDFNSDLAGFVKNRLDRITTKTNIYTTVYVLFRLSEKLKGIQRMAKTENENPKFSKII